MERLPGLFVAFLALTLDLQAMSAAFCNAGQHSPCILREGRVVRLPRHGACLGFSREVNWVGDEVKLERGDRILAYTDGLVEISGPEHAAIESILLSCSATDAFAPAVLEAVKRRAAAAAFTDDATLVSAVIR